MNPAPSAAPPWSRTVHPKHNHRPRRYRRFLSGVRRALDARERLFGRRYRPAPGAAKGAGNQ
jgi:hypothetical protein